MCLGLSIFIGYSIPQMISKLFDSFGNDQYFWEVGKLLAVVFFLEYINRFIYSLAVNKYVQYLMLQIRDICYRRWLFSRDDEQSRKHFPLGEVLARIMSDSESVRDLMNSGSFGIFIDFIFIISCLVSFITLNKFSGIFLMVVEAIACFILIYCSKFIGRVFTHARRENGIVSRKFADVCNGLDQNYYINNQSYASKQGGIVSDKFLKIQLKANVWDAGYYSCAESLFPVLLALLVVIFPYSHITEFAIIAALVDLIQRSINPIKSVAGKVSTIQQAMSGVRRVAGFVDSQKGSYWSTKDFSSKSLIDFHSIKVEIEEFCYESRSDRDFCLKDINFTASRGELVGIVGLSGCGKSTLLNILSCNLIPNKGMITLSSVSDKHIIFSKDHLQFLADFRRQVGIVSQESHIFTTSLLFNITMTEKSNRTEFDQFWAMAKEAIPYLDIWGVAPDDVINTGEISAGQKQLLSALRSCYLHKPVVLFDEISSSMDSDLEEALKTMVLILQKQSLTIIVAHRIETVVNSDKILVLDGGRLVAQGNHQQLLDISEIYREFIDEIKK